MRPPVPENDVRTAPHIDRVSIPVRRSVPSGASARPVAVSARPAGASRRPALSTSARPAIPSQHPAIVSSAPKAPGRTSRVQVSQAPGATGLDLQDALKSIAHKDYDRGITLLEAVLQGEPNNAQAKLWVRLALARKERARGKKEAALTAYRSVLDLDPKHHEARKAVDEMGTSKRSSILEWIGR